MNYTVISFYIYGEIGSPEAIKDTLQGLCIQYSILGRILVGTEGVNAAVSGTTTDIEQFKEELHKESLFSDLTFREQRVTENPYHKLVVRVRDEIVCLRKEVDLRNKAKYIEPQELKELLDNKEDVVLLDVRNTYETDVGKFKEAVTVSIENFSDFPASVKELSELKNKKIVTYCTGGIRCEKASAFLKEQGFKEVRQLHGGIINYLNQFPEAHFEGTCFVFDNRLVSKKDDNNAITNCVHCKEKSTQYINCHNLDCDKLVIVCNTCQEHKNKSCSEACSIAPRRRKEKLLKEEREIIGIVENYYAKSGVVLLKVQKGVINTHSTIGFVGKTTEAFSQEITTLRDYDGHTITEAREGQSITIQTTKKVRGNDRVCLVQ